MNRVNTDCIYFNGYSPCRFHKKESMHCQHCPYYKKFSKKILIIKLQAAGEVIRNTPLLHKLKEEYSDSRIFWLTKFPDLVPEQYVHKVLKFDLSSILFLLNENFDIVYSLDKDLEACSLANMIKAEVKKGFSQQNGVIVPFDEDSRSKWEMGIFDDLMAKNTRQYIEETFEICGFKWNGEKYILPDYSIPDIEIQTDKKIIGLNTGTGKIWRTREFSERKWISLINDLKNDYDYEIVLLGGTDEDLINKKISSMVDVNYFGVFPLLEFIGLMSKCDLIITSVTMALHIAIGLEKRIILLNNIFPANEFYLYELGEILEPDTPCKKCYKAKFDSMCYMSNCLDSIENEKIIQKIRELI